MRRLPFIAFAVVFFALSHSAAAALPPFELVQKSLAQQRSAAATVSLDLRVTQTRTAVREWKLSGKFELDEAATASNGVGVGPTSPTALRLLWIGLLAKDPVARLTEHYGSLKAPKSTVEVDEKFVYVYGAGPRVAVHRDLKRLAWFEISDDGVTWRAGFSWADGRVTGVLVTRDGKTVLTARSATALPGASRRGD